MPDARTDMPSWTRSSWFKWSWLLLLVVVIAQSLDYHWRALPTSATGYYARGRADYMRRLYRDAIENLTKSIELQPEDADAYLLRGKAYAKLHDLGRAMPDLEKAIDLRPDYDKSRTAYADGRAAAWDAEGAIREYSRAIAADSLSGRYYLERGKLFYDSERWDDAAADLGRGATVLLGDDQVTAQLLLWAARARSGAAFSATAKLSSTLAAGRIRGDRFWTNARFLCGETGEPAHLASLATLEGDDQAERKAEALFLAGAKRLAFGERREGLALMQDALRTEAGSSYAYDRARVELENLLLGFHPTQLLEAGAGLAIASVAPGGPAEASGIRAGSTLTAIDGVGANRDAFLTFLAKAEPGSTVELQLTGGDGSRVSVPLTLTPDSSAPTR